jgi:hypothetical protein
MAKETAPSGKCARRSQNNEIGNAKTGEKQAIRFHLIALTGYHDPRADAEDLNELMSHARPVPDRSRAGSACASTRDRRRRAARRRSFPDGGPDDVRTLHT